MDTHKKQYAVVIRLRPRILIEKLPALE